MKVTIDGQEYVPAAPVCENPSVLDVRTYVADLDREVSLREYFQSLLHTLWEEGEGFSGKRPFGNSGWQWDVYKFLILAKAVDGRLDEDGYVEEVDQMSANQLVPGLIAAALAPSQP